VSGEEAARNLVLLLIVLFQNFHVFNCRSERASAFRVPLGRNPVLVAGVALALGLHLAATYLPFTQTVLRVAPVSLREFLTLAAVASSVLVVLEVYKPLGGGGRVERRAIKLLEARAARL